MIEEILQEYTPYLVKGKTLYDVEDVKKMIVQIIQKMMPCPKQSVCESYAEATC